MLLEQRGCTEFSSIKYKEIQGKFKQPKSDKTRKMPLSATDRHNAHLKLQQTMLWHSPAPFVSSSLIQKELNLLNNLGTTSRIKAQSFPTTNQFQPKQAKMPSFRPLSSIVSAFHSDIEQRELVHKTHKPISTFHSSAPVKNKVSALVVAYDKLASPYLVSSPKKPAPKGISIHHRKSRDKSAKNKEIDYSFRTVLFLLS
jgi:hypothetical protein